jgi:hypothetical protein
MRVRSCWQWKDRPRALLQRGVGALEADRNRCADCRRTPLTGEQVHLYAGRQHVIVCELCRWRHADPPVATELVRHCEHGHAVRLTARVGRARLAEPASGELAPRAA